MCNNNQSNKPRGNVFNENFNHNISKSPKNGKLPVGQFNPIIKPANNQTPSQGQNKNGQN